MVKKFGIKREQYKNVKRMDHKQMESFTCTTKDSATASRQQIQKG